MRYLNLANRISNNNSLEFLISLIDLSPSMDDDDWKPTRKAGAVKANIDLMELKARHHPQDKACIIGFGGDAQILYHPTLLSGGIKGIKNALKHTPESYGTNFTAALELAERCFFARNNSSVKSGSNNSFLKTLSDIFCEPASYSDIDVDSKTLRRIIMLTDGEHNGGGSPVNIAKRLKNAGVVIDCIGIGGSPADVDEKLLKQIASQNPDGSIRYCFIGDQQQLIRKYQSLAQHIRPV